jgi:tellurite resistance protein
MPRRMSILAPIETTAPATRAVAAAIACKPHRIRQIKVALNKVLAQRNHYIPLMSQSSAGSPNRYIPASFFGMVLGLSGLGTSWRLAASMWSLPRAVGEVILLAASAIWAVLLLLYAAKWIWARAQALAEFRHPVQCCFIGIIPVSTALIGLALRPYALEAANALVIVGIVGQLIFGVHRTGQLWMGSRDPTTTTPVLYLPTVAGSFVSVIALGGLGHSDWAAPFFGLGLLSWLAIESVVLHRLYTVELPPPLRPTLGIQLAPPAVGCTAYLVLTSGPPDFFAQALFGYAIFQTLVMIRLIPWIARQPFAPSYWAFTFGLSALAIASLRFAERGPTGLVGHAAPFIFVAVNILIGGIAAGTAWLLLRGRLLPPPLQPSPETLHPAAPVG